MDTNGNIKTRIDHHIIKLYLSNVYLNGTKIFFNGNQMTSMSLNIVNNCIEINMSIILGIGFAIYNSKSACDPIITTQYFFMY